MRLLHERKEFKSGLRPDSHAPWAKAAFLSKIPKGPLLTVLTRGNEILLTKASIGGSQKVEVWG